MSFFSDLFGGANEAANDQINNINAGRTLATGNINQGSADLTSNYTAGLSPFLANYAGANAGTTQLGNVLGLNGPAGNNSAAATLATTPGYQFTLGQGNNAINAAAAANGTLGSGNQATALAQFGQGLAGTTANNYISQLTPYLGAASSAAGGIGGLYSGLGSSLNANQGNLANLNYGAQTSIGNAEASNALANQSLGLGLLGGGLSLGSSLFGGMGGFGGLGSGLSNGIAGLMGYSGSGSGMLGAVGSDERLKDEIEPVGELFDGQKVYSYKYKWDPFTTHIGLMAQEVEQRFPEAVVESKEGFKAVHYDRATEYASELGKFLEAA